MFSHRYDQTQQCVCGTDLCNKDFETAGAQTPTTPNTTPTTAPPSGKDDDAGGDGGDGHDGDDGDDDDGDGDDGAEAGAPTPTTCQESFKYF